MATTELSLSGLSDSVYEMKRMLMKMEKPSTNMICLSQAPLKVNMEYGKVLIARKDSRTFTLGPERNVSSPLDVPFIKAKITTQEIVDMIREAGQR